MLTIEQAEELDAKAAKGLKFGMSNISYLRHIQIHHFVGFNSCLIIFLHNDNIFIDKTADKKSTEDNEEKRKKRRRAKSISGYRR